MIPPKTEQQDALDRVAARMEESFDGFVVLGFRKQDNGDWLIHDIMRGSLLLNAHLTTAFVEQMCNELKELDNE